MKKLLAFLTVIMLLAGCEHNELSTKHVEGDTWEDSLYQYRVVVQKRSKHETLAERHKRLFGDVIAEKVVCIENMTFVKTGEGSIVQIKNHNGTYKKCETGDKNNPIPYTKGMETEIGKYYKVGDSTIQSTHGNKTPNFGYGSKSTPIPYKKGLPINMNWWYDVGGVNMKAIHGDPLGILEVNELFAKNDLDRRESF
jgi:hypothetical protein